MPKGLTSARVTGRVTGLGGVIFLLPWASTKAPLYFTNLSPQQGEAVSESDSPIMPPGEHYEILTGEDTASLGFQRE